MYNLNIIALPIPNSANDSIVNIFVNSPLTPKYSVLNTLINTVLHINCNTNINILGEYNDLTTVAIGDKLIIPEADE